MTISDNKKEQAAIREAIQEAIPVGVSYNNIIVVLSELLNNAILRQFKIKEREAGGDEG